MCSSGGGGSSGGAWCGLRRAHLDLSENQLALAVVGGVAQVVVVARRNKEARTRGQRHLGLMDGQINLNTPTDTDTNTHGQIDQTTDVNKKHNHGTITITITHKHTQTHVSTMDIHSTNHIHTQIDTCA